MYIRIASPQHTAVNYLQNFYMGFDCQAARSLPGSTDYAFKASGLQRKGLCQVVPTNRQPECLLAVQLPWLLGFRIAEDENLISYAGSLLRLYLHKNGDNGPRIKAIAQKFYGKLRELIRVFELNSSQLTEGTISYKVMNPISTATSILI